MINLNSTFTNNDEKFWKYGIVALWMAFFAHFLIMLFFYLHHVPEMVTFNFVSLFVFGLCIYAVSVKKYTYVMDFVHLEVVAHAILSTYFIGLESGFYYYVFILVISSLIVKQNTVKYHIVKSILFMGSFFFIEILFANLVPVYAVDPNTLLMARVLNIFGLLIFSIPFMYYYISSDLEVSKQMYSYATKDQLTGLNNRRYMDSIVEYEYSKRDFDSLVVVLADIDFFKKINDTYGHHCGDEVLVKVSRTLEKCIRQEDTLARWGGEEFLFFMPGADIENAQVLLQRVRKSIAELSFTCNGVKEIKIALTYGVAQKEKDEDFGSILARADIALYDGKQKGRDCVMISSGT